LRNIPEPLGQFAPRCPALRIVCQLGHLVAISRVFVKLFRQIHIHFHLAPNPGPTVSSNLNAGLLVPSQTSPSLWFRTRFPDKSHNHTAVDPATTQVFINHIGSANNTWVATNNKRFGRGRHSATAPEPTDRRGVGPWGETAGRSIGNVSLRIFVPWSPRKTGAGTRRKATGTRRNRRVRWNKRARCGIALMMIRRKSILPKEQ